MVPGAEHSGAAARSHHPLPIPPASGRRGLSDFQRSQIKIIDIFTCDPYAGTFLQGQLMGDIKGTGVSGIPNLKIVTPNH